MKVLHIITRLDRGGSAEAFLDLVSDLKRLGHDISVATGPVLEPQADIDAFSKATGIQVNYIPFLKRNVDPVRDILAFLGILKLIRSINPEVIHTHTSKAGFIGRIAGRIAMIKVIVHTPHGHIFYGYYGGLASRIFIFLERIAAKFSDRIITLTDIEKREYINKGIAADDRIVTIPCGIYIDQFTKSNKSIRDELGIPPGSPLVGWVGRLEHVKGCEYFLRACHLMKKEVPYAKYLVVGEGSLKREMEELACLLGLQEEVIFLGFREDIPSIMGSIDLLVHTPLNEGLGKVLLEAMASAKPVVASAVGGIPEIITHGLNGLLAPAGDYVSIATESVRILKDKALAERLGREGRKKAGAFDNRRLVEETLKLYKGLLVR